MMRMKPVKVLEDVPVSVKTTDSSPSPAQLDVTSTLAFSTSDGFMFKSSSVNLKHQGNMSKNNREMWRENSLLSVLTDLIAGSYGLMGQSWQSVKAERTILHDHSRLESYGADIPAGSYSLLTDVH
eukprot:746090-Hanusia_phi.AAC.11